MNSVVTPAPLVSPQPALPAAGLIFSLFIVGLGMLVDVYDVWLFTVVRQPSLVSIGVPASALMSTGIMLLNLQVAGMVVGGIFWGLVGDARGRKSVLFGSILLYSVANLLNGLICDVPAYGFFALFSRGRFSR